MLAKCFHHRVVHLPVRSVSLVIHDVDEATRLVLEKINALSIVKVQHCRDKSGDALCLVLVDVWLEDTLLNKVLQTLVGKVDAELVKGVGAASHVLGTRKIKEPNKCIKAVTIEALVDVFVQPSKKERIESLGKVITAVRSTIGVEKDGAELLPDELSLIC